MIGQKPKIIGIALTMSALSHSCKTRRSGLSDEVSEQNVQRILSQMDQDAARLEGSINSEIANFKALNPELRQTMLTKYRAFKETDAQGKPVNWDKYPIFEFDLSGAKRGFVVPRLIDFPVRLPNGENVSVRISFTSDDILRSSIWVRNILAQASSGFYDGLPVRLSSSEIGDVIGFNLINRSTDWVQTEPVAKTNPETPGATTQPTPPATSQPTGDSPEACSDGLCSIAGEPADQNANALSQLPGLPSSALSSVMGIPLTEIMNPIYTISSLNMVSRGEVIRQEIRFGDVFTVKHHGSLVGSGFGIWMSEKPLSLANAEDTDVVVFGQIAGDTAGALQKIANALDTKGQVGAAPLQATVAGAARIGAAGPKQDLSSYSGNLYRLNWDVIRGGILVDEFEGAKKTVTLLGAGTVEGRPAITADATETERALISKRISELEKIVADHMEMLRLTDEYLQRLSEFKSMKREQFEVFNNLVTNFEKDLGILDVNAMTLQQQFYTNYFLRLKENKTTPAQAKKIEEINNALANLVLATKAVVPLFYAAFDSLNFMGMRKPFSKAYMDALVYNSNMVAAGLSIAPVNYGLYQHAGERFIYGKNLSFYDWQMGLFSSYATLDKSLAEWLIYRDFRTMLREMTGEEPPRLPNSGSNGFLDHVVPAKTEYIWNDLSQDTRNKIVGYLNRNAHKIFLTLDSTRIDFMTKNVRGEDENKLFPMFMPAITRPERYLGKSREIWKEKVVDPNFKKFKDVMTLKIQGTEAVRILSQELLQTIR
jgi:hypothetical protein